MIEVRVPPGQGRGPDGLERPDRESGRRASRSKARVAGEGAAGGSEPQARARFQRVYLDFCAQEVDAWACPGGNSAREPRERVRSGFRDGRDRPGGDVDYRRRFYHTFADYLVAATMLAVMRGLNDIYLGDNCTAAETLEWTYGTCRRSPGTPARWCGR